MDQVGWVVGMGAEHVITDAGSVTDPGRSVLVEAV